MKNGPKGGRVNGKASGPLAPTVHEDSTRYFSAIEGKAIVGTYCDKCFRSAPVFILEQVTDPGPDLYLVPVCAPDLPVRSISTRNLIVLLIRTVKVSGATKSVFGECSRLR